MKGSESNLIDNWRSLFDYTILTRGRRYQLAGHVRGLSITGNEKNILARVRGTHLYTVQIQTDGTSITKTFCSCPYAEDGTLCKHMAAVLFEAEEKGIIHKIKEEGLKSRKKIRIQSLSEWLLEEWKVHPKAAPKKGTSFYFDPLVLGKELLISEEGWIDAKRLVRTGKMKQKPLRIDYGQAAQYCENSNYLAGRAEGELKEADPNQKNRSFWNAQEVQLYFQKEGITFFCCRVAGCTNQFQTHSLRYDKQIKQSLVCCHIAALFLLLTADLLRENPGDATNRAAADFLKQIQHTAGNRQKSSYVPQELSETGAALLLEPHLSKNPEGDALQLSFKIGWKKLYVLKDIHFLLRQVEKNGEIELGTTKREQISVQEENFEQKSRAYLQFLQQICEDEQEWLNARKRKQYSALEQENSVMEGKECTIYGRWLDRFFEISEDSAVEFTESVRGLKQKKQISFRTYAPKFVFRITQKRCEEGSLEAVVLSGKMPQFYQGASYVYYIDNGYLNRVERSCYEKFKPLAEKAKDGKLELVIGKNALAAFYYKAVPWLEQIAEVRDLERERIEEVLPPEAELHFYLDAADQDVTCLPEAVYGEKHVLLKEEDHPIRNRVQTDRVADCSISSFYRDRVREREALETVQRFFPVQAPDSDSDSAAAPFLEAEKAGAEKVYRCGGDEEAIFQVLNRGVQVLMELGEVHATDAFKRLRIRKKLQLQAGVSLKAGLLDLELSSEEIDQDELLAILESYRKKKRFYRLKNGTFVPLEEDGIARLSELMTALKLSPKEFVKGKMHVPAYRALYLDQMLEGIDALYVERDQHYKRLIRSFKTVQEADFEVPVPLKKVLRTYQKTGYRWLRTLESGGFGGILADDMGLGKTLQVIAVLLAAKLEMKADMSLVIAPASLVYNWKEELERFAPALRVRTVTGAQAERMALLEEAKEGNIDVLLTSYDLLKRDIDAYDGLSFRYEIIDEAQYIKNHMTAAAKTVKVIKSRTRYALTGTPIENRLSELWSIFDYLMPGFLYTYETFRREIELPVVKDHSEAAATCLQRMIVPFVLRRLKTEVLRDLPEKLEEVRYAAAEKEQQDLYDAQVLKLRQLLLAGDDAQFQKTRIKILAELTRLRQICCDPGLLFSEYQGGSAKRDLCLELIQNAIDGGHRLLVFSQFTSMLEMLEDSLKEKKITYEKLTGETPKEERMKLVRSFNEGAASVFLISLKAGGTGLNLTGADMVIHYDPWWNVAAQNQATDRAYRIGQKNTVTVYQLILKGSIEEKILALQQQKQELADQVLSGENGTLGSMGREELLEILGGKPQG